MKLRYTSEALEELQRLLSDLAVRSPQAAQVVRSRIRTTARLLTEHSLSGRQTSRRSLRRIVVAPYPYLIFYEARDDEVIIVAIRHAARNPTSMPDA